DVLPQHADAAAVRRGQAGKQADGGGLAMPVVAEEGEHAALGDHQLQVLQYPPWAVGLVDGLQFDRCTWHGAWAPGCPPQAVVQRTPASGRWRRACQAAANAVNPTNDRGCAQSVAAPGAGRGGGSATIRAPLPHTRGPGSQARQWRQTRPGPGEVAPVPRPEFAPPGRCRTADE